MYSRPLAARSGLLRRQAARLSRCRSPLCLSSSRSLHRAQASNVGTETESLVDHELIEEREEEKVFTGNVDISKVKEFLLNVVDSTDIAEIEIESSQLELYVRRDVAPAAAPAPAAESKDEDESAVALVSETV